MARNDADFRKRREGRYHCLDAGAPSAGRVVRFQSQPMPAPQASSPAAAPTRPLRIARAWRLIRGGALALFALQVAGSLDTVLPAAPEDRLGFALYAVGWLTLAGALTYGVCKGMTWALRTAGVLAALSLPVYLASPFFPRVDIGGVPHYASPLSAPLDILSGVACGVLLTGLWRLARARRA
jgi:hypothetical protein